MLRVEQSHFFPEISVGYTRQDILPLKNLNAWMIGVSFPIYFLPQKSKVKQARLTATSAQIQADANIRELRNKTLEPKHPFADIMRVYDIIPLLP
ncbi:TolC family protein [Bacteroides xylanisolvens]|nr:TolC family protein [Bacteroides xylanisolvens]